MVMKWTAEMGLAVKMRPAIGVVALGALQIFSSRAGAEVTGVGNTGFEGSTGVSAP
ncbi:MAG TPA: hypothetical protein VGL87_01805 [Steroidobacteraceae bacterium]